MRGWHASAARLALACLTTADTQVHLRRSRRNVSRIGGLAGL